MTIVKLHQGTWRNQTPHSLSSSQMTMKENNRLLIAAFFNCKLQYGCRNFRRFEW